MSRPAALRLRVSAGWRPMRGFTLIELLVVLVILGLIGGIAVPRVISYLGGAKVDTARLQIGSLETQVDLYRLDTGRYPSTEEGLAALWQRPASAERWNGPYVKRADMLNDPWGHPFAYRTPGRIPGRAADYDIWSLGADGAPGGSGEGADIGNW